MSELIYGEVTKLDVLVFGPHPDDAEIGTGGVLLKLAEAGRKCGIVDMTRGEMASGGTPEIRLKEAVAAAEVLKLAVRENMGIPDCGIEDNFDNRQAVAKVIRKYQPEVVLAPYYDLPPGRGLGHNDHIKGGLVVAHGSNYAHLARMDSETEKWHPKATYFYFLPPDLMPSFVVDVSDYYEDWVKSIYCHESQFGREDQNPGVRHFFSGMASRWGRQAGGRFAQAFFSPWPLVHGDVLSAAQVFTEVEEKRL